MQTRTKLVSAVFLATAMFLLLPKATFASNYTLSGKVTDSSGSAVAGATVSVNDLNNDSTTTDSSGSYSLSIPEGTYDIQVAPPIGSQYSPVMYADKTISSDTVVNFILVNSQQITLSGHTYDPLGNPMPNVAIKLRNSNTGDLIRSTTTDTSGSYSFSSVSPNTYMFEIVGGNHNSAIGASQDYNFKIYNYNLNQNTVQDFNLPFKKLSIHVQDAANQPVSGVSITNTSVGSQNYTWEGHTVVSTQSDNLTSVITDSSGNATLWVLPNLRFCYVTATPPSGSAYSATQLEVGGVSGDKDEVLSLQFIHGTPITTAALSPNPNSGGLYQNPTTVSLSATAVSGYSIVHTYYTVDGGSQQEYSAPFSITGSGDHTVTYWSVDNLGVTESPKSKTFTIKTNNPPVLDTIGNKTVDEGQQLQFTVSASDPDGDSLTYSAANLPQGATFDADTHTFSWTPDYGQADNYINVEFTVMDNGTPMELDVELITITVGHVNRPPVFDNPGPQEILSGSNLTFSVSATDPDNDIVTLSASDLPSGATFGANTGEFSWTPTAEQEGVVTVAFTATDDGDPAASASIEVAITVGHNPTPVELANHLVDDVVASSFPTNIENSYLANLQKVAIFIEQGKIQAAINQLDAFIQKLNQDYAQGIITASVRDEFVARAQQLIDKMSGN